RDARRELRFDFDDPCVDTDQRRAENLRNHARATSATAMPNDASGDDRIPRLCNIRNPDIFGLFTGIVRNSDVGGSELFALFFRAWNDRERLNDFIYGLLRLLSRRQRLARRR